MEYKELIKLVEDERNKLFSEYKKTNISKSIFEVYLNKYDELLFDLYTKYENILTRN